MFFRGYLLTFVSSIGGMITAAEPRYCSDCTTHTSGSAGILKTGAFDRL